MSYPVLLGVDFLKTFSVCLDFERNIISVRRIHEVLIQNNQQINPVDELLVYSVLKDSLDVAAIALTETLGFERQCALTTLKPQNPLVPLMLSHAQES